MALVRHACVDCKVESPPTDSNYSLIGLGGWRVLRAVQSDGSLASKWRCPSCWTKHKARTGSTTLINQPKLADLSPREASGGRRMR